MRIIKFRVYGKKMKRMIYPQELSSDGMSIDPNNKGLANINGTDNRLNVYDAYNKFHLMQFTGLEDKNSRDIFEGDIIPTPKFTTRGKFRFIVGKWNAEVVFHNAAFRLKTPDGKINALAMDDSEVAEEYRFEVIGNIYDDPELLEEAK